MSNSVCYTPYKYACSTAVKKRKSADTKLTLRMTHMALLQLGYCLGDSQGKASKELFVCAFCVKFLSGKSLCKQ